MRRTLLGLGLGLLALGLPLLTAEVYAQESAVCLPSNEITGDLGTPSDEGVNFQSNLNQITDVRRWLFRVPAGRTVYVYVGDQWYDLDLGVFSGQQEQAIACWRVRKGEAISERSQRRVLQLIRPDDRIIELAEGGEYALIVRAAFANDPTYAPDFDPNKPFTVRVATSPPLCSANPPNQEVDPRYPALKRRVADEQNLYQVGLNFVPLNPGRFDLLTFNVVVSPPFTDLFDFQWEIDGQPVPDSNVVTIQQAVSGLPSTPSGQHTVKVIAKGARVYPDPDQPHTPLDGGSLATECRFVVQG